MLLTGYSGIKGCRMKNFVIKPSILINPAFCIQNPRKRGVIPKSLSPLERKIFAIGITQINHKTHKKDTDFVYEIDINDIVVENHKGEKVKFYDANNDFKNIDSRCDNLLTKIIHLPRKKGFEKVGLVSHRKLEDNILQITFHKSLVPYLLDFTKGFTKYQIKNILLMKSSYAIGFYEMFKKDMWRSKYEHDSQMKFEFELEKLFDTLQIPLSMQKPAVLEREILKRVKNEINTHSDLYLHKYVLTKTGRKYTHITFHVIEKKNQRHIEPSSGPFLENYYRKKVRGYENDVFNLDSSNIEYFHESTFKKIVMEKLINKVFYIDGEYLILKDRDINRKGLFYSVVRLGEYMRFLKKIADEPRHEFEIKMDSNQSFEDLFYYMENNHIQNWEELFDADGVLRDDRYYDNIVEPDF